MPKGRASSSPEPSTPPASNGSEGSDSEGEQVPRRATRVGSLDGWELRWPGT
jgi:hypothetical protein